MSPIGVPRALAVRRPRECGKADCIRQCPPGPRRCAHQRCKGQRDGRHLAFPPTILVVRKLLKTFRTTLDFATGPAAFSRSLPINFRLPLLSFPLLVARAALHFISH